MTDEKKDDVEFEEVDVDTTSTQDLKKRAESLIQREMAKKSLAPIVPTTEGPSLDPDALMQERRTAIAEDQLIGLLRKGANSFQVLDQLIEDIATESASLKFERNVQERQLLETTRTSKARAQVLKMIGDLLETKRDLASQEVINLRSKRMQAVFKYLVSIVKGSIEEVTQISQEQRELFYTRLGRNMLNFEDEAEKLMSRIEDL